MRTRNLVRITATCSVFFALALGLSACGGDSSSSSAEEGGTITLDGRNANDHGTGAVSGDETDVEVDSFYFSPTVLTGTAGQKVTLKLENESSTLHNFSLTDQNVDMDIPAGGDVTVTVTMPDSGTAVFFCKYHQTNGMVGALQVA
jgi:plastocyanin